MYEEHCVVGLPEHAADDASASHVDAVLSSVVFVVTRFTLVATVPSDCRTDVGEVVEPARTPPENPP